MNIVMLLKYNVTSLYLVSVFVRFESENIDQQQVTNEHRSHKKASASGGKGFIQIEAGVPGAGRTR
ncbi:hypothetical protein [Candidatus Thalassolituus haligoni]|uniref:hypothetical protein n=1 Tax=Candidatus Thalassolituus haligoni TaxID=3100113 RepID=UPI00351269FA|tara:strand:- start:369 stop:566 length:198 start_codon:yes stop_codon:yes gene_type:complete